MTKVPSDEEVALQIIGVFLKNNLRSGGILRRNYFVEVRDADFQRGINKAVENDWIKIKPRDRYTYKLTEAGLQQFESWSLRRSQEPIRQLPLVAHAQGDDEHVVVLIVD